MLYNSSVTDKKNSNRLYSFLYLLAFYLGIDLLPIEKWIPLSAVAKLVRILLLTVLLIGACKEIVKNRKTENCSKIRYFDYFLLIPFLYGTGSNLFYSAFTNQQMTVAVTSEIVLDTFLTFVMAAMEEILFRYLLLTFFENLFINKKQKEILSILSSSVCFSLMHVVNFYGNAPMAVLAQLGYTLLLGFILGCLAVSYETPLLPILSHFLYNFLNMTLFNSLYSYSWDSGFIVYSIIVGLVLTGYSFFVYTLRGREKKKTLQKENRLNS